MRRLRVSRAPAVWTASLLWCLGCGAPASEPAETEPETATVPTLPFSPPTGPHAVGTFDVVWTDSSRSEPFTRDPGDLRSVAARVWYPAAPGGPGGAEYVGDVAEFGDDPDLAQAVHVRTHATPDAPVLDGGPFPVLVYHHGGGWTRFTSTFTTEEMASHGYVVVSVGHNGFNRTRFLPGGDPVAPDTLAFPDPTGDLLADAYGSWTHLDRHHFPEWVADARHALDRLDQMAETGPLSGSLDLDRIGMYGWSFGGATSIEASVVDERVKAAIDHDGQLFGQAASVGTSRPFMLFHGGTEPEGPPADSEEERARIQAAVDELMGVVAANDAKLKAASTGDWYDVVIAGTNHGSFSDLPLMVPGASPDIEPARAHRIINRLTLAFFDRYLRGLPAPVLDDPGAELPEVTLEKRVTP